jgi:hypothetical protein
MRLRRSSTPSARDSAAIRCADRLELLIVTIWALKREQLPAPYRETDLPDRLEAPADGTQVDSAAVPFVWGTTKLQDTGVGGVVVNVSTSWGVFPKVTILAAGREIPMRAGRSRIGA